jgi:cellulose synthase/poly-beta-1,6-N-acetylglucosamine synthase-like glycosyltransferase
MGLRVAQFLWDCELDGPSRAREVGVPHNSGQGLPSPVRDPVESGAWEAPSKTPGCCRISGGMASYNDALTIRDAVSSLLDQDLPEGVIWEHLWIVTSASSDGTIEVLKDLASHDPRIRILTEPERKGKVSALNQIFRHAAGDYLILLNADDRAAPGALRLLLSEAVGVPGRVAVMGRPVPGSSTPPGLRAILGLLWELHHCFHQELVQRGQAAHLSDNLLLLSRNCLQPLPEDVINDGAYLGVRLREVGGELRYAPGAVVLLSVPTSLADHLSQRRRIHVGHRQVARKLQRPPTTFQRAAITDPKLALRTLRRALSGSRDPLRALLGLSVLEGLARLLASWDMLPPEHDHVRWARIHQGSLSPTCRGQ